MIKDINKAVKTENMAKCPRCGLEFDVNYTCNRCGHKWVPRENGEPKVCPNCKSPYWNKARVRRVAKAIVARNRGRK